MLLNKLFFFSEEYLRGLKGCTCPCMNWRVNNTLAKQERMPNLLKKMLAVAPHFLSEM